MKRDLFAELNEGMKAWEEANEGKLTLKTHKRRLKNDIFISPDELKSIRSKLNISQAVFAQYLHTGETTYQNWEQGRAKPNKQAVLLIKMVERNPQALEFLASLT
ncbi:helix-turn-helix domain-containing protein [Photorhabdus laumondii subsp. laumondii]|uniref:Photorhabdus luminescens subsp. laumondii TTO1 complete genome segment 8/17 n=5 Tax=Photorhabdus TaxID=29487 RepID=Q7N559_PHOLL|nr:MULTISPECIES: type II toxin-antitoxin system MqsA family antitoxin [Photorhabdus]AWK41890.1 transcriptional regulator [Photorhabdus laumondii subsp. laumondii]AXG42753.1 transcriptional regulator [Photorhabdus laumondii subsp. laumondii]AXG47212.1 transcriptional regulator [Photorhabdus laumondii subsp. laumondii]MCC8374377.1 type II toxin-antitoxin system MqsA family antitoxin [Photorhabdus bodei]MCC8383631.1 type II toxin-antitoxin system MqsA family antitoxin [Photorhabdus laumondii]